MSYTEAEYKAAADTYSVPVPSVKTVIKVEANGDGFLPDGRPKILFEAHHFGKRTGYQFNDSHPLISVGSWAQARVLYLGGPAEYDRLGQAKSLNETAALESASWGAGQVMGFNWKALGFSSVQEFVKHMATAAGQMDAMMRYCKVNNLLQHMRRFPDMEACRAFAAGYNGSGAVDVYGPKLAEAFAEASGAPRTTLKRGDRGDDVKAMQAALGIKPDGDFGPGTEVAVRLLQADQGLVIDGVAGPRTLAVLKQRRAA
jgi:peptidoglycan hydrolase-like protein with peptidoglycan-binding domain